MKRKPKTENRKLQDKLWIECRRITRLRYCKDGRYFCFTCDKEITGSGVQTGHFIPNSTGGALLRYNLNNLRLQCYYCNINLGGNGSEFYPRLVREMGQKHVDDLFILKKQSTKASDHYIKIYEEYQKITE